MVVIVIELDSRFLNLISEYQSSKRKCEAMVVNWRWAKSDRHDPRPFWYERNRWKPGQFLKSNPARPNGFYEYGYDSDGNVVVGRNHVSSEPDRIWFYETFYIRSGNILEIIHFDYHPEKKPIYLTRCTYQDNRLILWESRATSGSRREYYQWEKDRVKIVEVNYAKIGPDQQYKEPNPWQRIEAKYSEIGSLEELTVHWIKGPEQPKETVEIVYHRLEKTINFKILLDLSREKLFEIIKNKVIALQLSEPVYCLAIVRGQSFPPHIGLGFARDRDKLISEQQEELWWFLWNPAEFSFITIDKFIFDDPELIRICDLLNQECGRRDRWNDAAKMLNDVAKMLNQVDWRGILPTTPDFVAYATDDELGDFQKNLKSTISSDLYKHFKMNGWLP
jgi:hypothetical protein